MILLMMEHMKKLLVWIPWMSFLAFPLHAQEREVRVYVEDGFLKKALSDVKISVLNTDSTMVVDSLSFSKVFGMNGMVLLRARYSTFLPAEKKNYLLHVTKRGYSEVWHPISVPDNKKDLLELPTIRMRKSMERDLSEVEVKATRVKMYYRGDTIVYNADAFNLPDGSMLDALIRQLPGVKMTDKGEIYVNGRKVDELLLGSRSFLRGNRKVLLENLPYYTVENIKAYNKRTDKSEALGYDVEAPRYVMDVNLKKEYSMGYIANLEGAAGTQERWMGRVFLLGFTDILQYGVMGNINNLNETNHIGERGYWRPTFAPLSPVTTRSAASFIDYASKDRRTKDHLDVNFTSTGKRQQSRQWYEQFVENGSPTSTTESFDNADNWCLKISNSLTLTKPSYFDARTSFNYEKHDGRSGSQFEQRDSVLTAASRTDGISEGRKWEITQEFSGAFNVMKEKQQHISYGGYFSHEDDQAWRSSRYDTWQPLTGTNSVRHNANDVYMKGTWFSARAHYNSGPLLKKATLVVGNDFRFSDINRHDYLYHPDTLMLASEIDMLTAITDPSNSYEKHTRYWNERIKVFLSQKKSYQLNPFMSSEYDWWKVGFELPVIHQSMDYKRGIIDTLVCENRVYIWPTASFQQVWLEGKRRFSINAKYECNPADLENCIDYRDDSQPLVIRLGNPGLKGRAATNVSLSLMDNHHPRQQQWNLGASLDYHHRDVAQSTSYNPQTGVYTYKPMNVKGAYTTNGQFAFSGALDEKERWSWSTGTDAGFHHAIDHAMLEGDTESHRNAVNTTTLHEGLQLQYHKDVLAIGISGDIKWRHSEGKMQNFETLDAFDYNYGLNARYTIPVLKTFISANATMYSRRGYGSASFNTDDFLVNASIEQSVWKNRITARLEIYDLLHQLSSVTYEVSAQGRTESWRRTLPHYVMLHLVYRWSKSPEKNNGNAIPLPPL